MLQALIGYQQLLDYLKRRPGLQTTKVYCTLDSLDPEREKEELKKLFSSIQSFLDMIVIVMKRELPRELLEESSDLLYLYSRLDPTSGGYKLLQSKLEGLTSLCEDALSIHVQPVGVCPRETQSFLRVGWKEGNHTSFVYTEFCMSLRTKLLIPCLVGDTAYEEVWDRSFLYRTNKGNVRCGTCLTCT